MTREAATKLARRYFDLGTHTVSGLRLKAGGWLARMDAYDFAAALVFVTLIGLVAFTFGDYGISNDEEVQQRYGELIVRYYTSGLADRAVFHFRNLYLYGGLFDVVAVGLQKLLPLDPYAVRHLLSALTGIGGIAAVWATARSIGGPRAGLLAALALAVCGVWYGAMFNHTKDIPFAAAMMIATYLLLQIGRQLPRPNWGLVVLFGIACGCAVGLRVLGYFLISYAALTVVLRMLAAAGSWSEFLNKWRGAFVFAARSALPFTAAFVIAYLIMIVVWPWAHRAPLNPLRGFSAFVDFHYPIQTTLFGHVYRMADVPRWYVPTYIGIKLTLWLLVGAVAALAFVLRPATRADRTQVVRDRAPLADLRAVAPHARDRFAFRDELRAQLAHAATAAAVTAGRAWHGQLRMPPQESVQGVDHDLRVARSRKAPRAVAQGGVLAREALAAELRAQQPHDRTQPLEDLARLVHRPLAHLRAVGRSGMAIEQLDRDVELTERHTAQSRR